MKEISIISPGTRLCAQLFIAGLVAGEIIIAQWIDLRPIVWPVACLCALISIAAFLVLFILPIETLSASHRKSIGRGAFYGLFFAVISACSLFLAYQIAARDWYGFASYALAAFVGAIATGLIFRKTRE